ncbi:hypothetical protein D6U73_17330 [Vibrio cholerae]|nr:hypothetical protein [Vibrio cholerae]
MNEYASIFWFIVGLALLGFGIVKWLNARLMLSQLKSNNHPEYTKYVIHFIYGSLGFGLVVIFAFLFSKAWLIWG